MGELSPVSVCFRDCHMTGFGNHLRLTGFCHEHALILYVYLPNDNGDDESVLTVRADLELIGNQEHANRLTVLR